MRISASIRNSDQLNEATVTTQGNTRMLSVPAKPAGGGSAVNGGELLMLAIATCYCNDLYREAARLGIEVHGVEVEASAEFNGIGLAAASVTYSARLQTDEPLERIEQLLKETDAVAEIHNTIRAPVAVTLVAWSERS